MRLQRMDISGDLLRRKEEWKETVPMTPFIRAVIRSTRVGFEGCFDFMRTAVLSTTVSIAFRPAAFIVSPDSRDVINEESL